eukprot:TRINITY_DN1813_c0_g1_i1.p1 TRINITY_DN1813_c0_g1~~TRINITY_DN1813_c0_g1_i1.p1  ORF type:complete len:126 (+),score=24.12 TRINITY_DN1813_c0_g1_i1:46-423(+)
MANVATNPKVLKFYRRCLKAIPETIKYYQLPFSTSDVKHKINSEFRRYEGVQDDSVIEMLLAKGRQELEETEEMWKTKSHVLRYFTSKNQKYIPKNNEYMTEADKALHDILRDDPRNLDNHARFK